jgi:hypothetical protein
METFGVRYDPAEDFDHPQLSEGHLLRWHVLYRLGRDEWARHQHPENGRRCRKVLLTDRRLIVPMHGG